jgi:RNA polymerase sigma-70 factor (ECF subfamily)
MSINTLHPAWSGANLTARQRSETSPSITADVGFLNESKGTITSPGTRGFEKVVLPNLDAAYNLARWLVRDGTLAEDVVQDAVLRALMYFSSFRHGNERAWLLRIVRNTAYAHLNRRRTETSLSLGGDSDQDGAEGVGMNVPDPAPDPETNLAHLEDLSQLNAALAALPIEQRECLVLCELEQLSYKDIAEITEVPVGTVMSRLWRARQALMRCAS